MRPEAMQVLYGQRFHSPCACTPRQSGMLLWETYTCSCMLPPPVLFSCALPSLPPMQKMAAACTFVASKLEECHKWVGKMRGDAQLLVWGCGRDAHRCVGECTGRQGGGPPYRCMPRMRPTA